MLSPLADRICLSDSGAIGGIVFSQRPLETGSAVAAINSARNPGGTVFAWYS
jgi:hypothetical protein